MGWENTEETLIRKKAYNDAILEGIRDGKNEVYQITVEDALGFTREELVTALIKHGLYKQFKPNKSMSGAASA